MENLKLSINFNSSISQYGCPATTFCPFKGRQGLKHIEFVREQLNLPNLSLDKITSPEFQHRWVEEISVQDAAKVISENGRMFDYKVWPTVWIIADNDDSVERLKELLETTVKVKYDDNGGVEWAHAITKINWEKALAFIQDMQVNITSTLDYVHI